MRPEVLVLGREGHKRVASVLYPMANEWGWGAWGVLATLFGTAHPAAVRAYRLRRTFDKLRCDLDGKWSSEARWLEMEGTGVWEDLYYGEKDRGDPELPPWPDVKRPSPRRLPREFPSLESQKQALVCIDRMAEWSGQVAEELAGIYGKADSAAVYAAKASALAKQVASGTKGCRPMSVASWI